MPDDDMMPKIAQIYTFECLTRRTLLILDQFLLTGLKSCYDRFKEDGERHPTKTMSVRTQQLGAKYANHGIYNRPT